MEDALLEKGRGTDAEWEGAGGEKDKRTSPEGRAVLISGSINI